MATATANVPYSDPKATSDRARERNQKTLRISVVDNGYIVTEMGTGETRVYEDAGKLEVSESDLPVNLSDHLRRFIGRF